ncbi:hypothetical protein BGZ98_004734 [Dissophora globulifera]|nr:hypothetical protein BGZ98_004734 [Dissophora globulifera]
MHAHSLILQARSAYFVRALNNEWKEANQGVIHKPNISPTVFERILQYIYGGRLMVDDELVMDLIKAADELCMEDLLHGCERHALSIVCRNNVFDMVHLAYQHNLPQLKAECLDFIASNIDHLKRGKAILTLDSDILKDILSMDQLDLEELEIWKIAVRWAYFQQGLDWEQCLLLDFPKGSGCVVVQLVADDGSGNLHLDDDDYVDGAKDDVAQAPLHGTTVRVGRTLDVDEDGFRATASVFQQAATHTVVQLPATVHDELRKQIAPVLPAIRFMRIPSVDFLRLIEGTGLLPVHLCAKVYRYHSVPSMADPYQTSLQRRMAFSTIMSKENKEVVLEWLQAMLEGRLSTLSTSKIPWHRRSSMLSSSPPLGIASPSTSLRSAPVFYSLYEPAELTAFLPSTTTTDTTPPSPLLTRGFNTSSPTSPRTSRIGASVTSPLTMSAFQDPQPQQQHQQQPMSLQSRVPQPKLVLQYRATRDGFDASNFHMACDQRGPTLTVIRADNGAIFGGYNSSSWSSHPSGVYSTSRTNFLFTLKSREQPARENGIFSIKGDGNAAAYNKADFGPTFGVGHDLFLASNCNLNSNSSSTMPSSYNGQGASTAVLAGSFNFRVQEYEVFLVQSLNPSFTT